MAVRQEDSSEIQDARDNGKTTKKSVTGSIGAVKSSVVGSVDSRPVRYYDINSALLHEGGVLQAGSLENPGRKCISADTRSSKS